MWIISLFGFLFLLLTTIPPSAADVSHLAFNGVNNNFFDDLSLLRQNLRGEPNVDYPIYSHPPDTSFSCAGRHDGYYADTETRCQVFRVCANTDLTGHGFAFLCPNGTLFNQKHFVCDWHYNVDCGQSFAFYAKNEELGKRIDNHDHMMTMVKYMQNFVMAQGFGQAQPTASQSGSASAVFNTGGGSGGSSGFGPSLATQGGGSSFGQSFGDSSSSATNFDASNHNRAHQKIYVSNLGELSTEPGSGFDYSKSNIINPNLSSHQSGSSTTYKGADFGNSKVSSQPFHGKFNAVFSGTGNLIGLGSHVSSGTAKFSGSAVQSNSIYLPPRPPVQNTYIPPRATPQVSQVPSLGSSGVSGSTHQKFPSFSGNLVTTPPRVSTTTRFPATSPPTSRLPATPPPTSRLPATPPPAPRFPVPEAVADPLLDIRFGDDEGVTKKSVSAPSMYFSVPLSPVEIKERELKKLGLLPRTQDQDSAKEGSAFFPQTVQFPRFNAAVPAVPLSTGYSGYTQSSPVSYYQRPQVHQTHQTSQTFASRFSSPANERVTDIQIIPARGYYFNDPNERKQYYDAVARGLFNDHESGYVYIKPRFSQLQEVPRQRIPTVVKNHELQHSGYNFGKNMYAGLFNHLATSSDYSSHASPQKVLEARDTEGSIFRGFDSYAAPLNHVGQLPTDTVYRPQSQSRALRPF